MKISTAITTILFAGAISFGASAQPAATAETAQDANATPQAMPMMGNPQGGGMPCMMQRMQQGQAMMPQHMQNMETRLANIEALLKELVELQKKK
ncbi:MAG: hypothetical protein A2286_03640 [Gammaproteobacteria bacterium RIFOXYA12_FULL_61_12]|nr:MAG: hypothetical protein A2286_03640 [Gammaproteobacteria bacterium RIFOXYA12_FULL_61_12]OGT88492.1 MAG: hypothetical protein A2514_02405 [Gammaproteobacteria bacterium RIFOXYD12_FULL_61_37]